MTLVRFCSGSLARSRWLLPTRAWSSSKWSSSSALPSAVRPDGGRDALLLTPGPLTTSYATKAAAMHDVGSRDAGFMAVVAEVRAGVLALAAVSPSHYAMVPMQGCGTMGVEAVLSSVVPHRLLIAVNGAYGDRIARMADVHHIAYSRIDFPEDQVVTGASLHTALQQHPDTTMVAVVHSETTSGIVNPIEEIGAVVKQHGKQLFVDAMSSFGGIPIDFEGSGIDYLVSSPNKCVEGIPGFSFVIARKESLQACRGNARTLSLDVHAQWDGLEKNGQFRFTPPTHSLLAFHQALAELRLEGGVQNRYQRYRRLQSIAVHGLRSLGFKPYLADDLRGPIVTSFHYPESDKWTFDVFYQKLNDRGILIYPGKVSNVDCFRVGHIGRLSEDDMKTFVKVVGEVMQEIEG